jgi:hypothetical protein
VVSTVNEHRDGVSPAGEQGIFPPDLGRE